jgi:hypothetical protein
VPNSSKKNWKRKIKCHAMDQVIIHCHYLR